MRLNLKQTKFVGLTMKLDLKTREYTRLCDKLEKYKEEKINDDDEKLYELLCQFQQNYIEILEIKKQLNEIKNVNEKSDEKAENFNYNDMFKKNIQSDKKKDFECKALVEQKKQNKIQKIINYIKKFIV